MEIIREKTGYKRMLEEVISGLNKPQKTLPSKYFYDERGSELFEQICSLKEYYPPDAESEIMEKRIGEITNVLGSGIDLIEFGSGSSFKTRYLLDHLENINTYIPVDISEDFLNESTRQLSIEYPNLHILPVAADYTQPIQLPAESSGNRKVVYFPGSTIGNFTPDEARNFLTLIAKSTGENGGLLIGVDLKKDRDILEAAYNDPGGVTATFNKNILTRINRDLDADFDTDRFIHKAFYNEIEGRIEMHLVSLDNQEAWIGGRCFTFQNGETIHTENSYKYTVGEFKKLVSGLFEVEHVWLDGSKLFSVQYLQPNNPLNVFKNN